MKKTLIALCIATTLTLPAHARSLQADPSEKLFSIDDWSELTETIGSMKLKVMHNEQPPQFMREGLPHKWTVSQVDSVVFFKKLNAMRNMPEKQMELEIPNKRTSYTGIKLTFNARDSYKYEPLTIYNGAIKTASGKTIMKDPNRTLEYWLFSTNSEQYNARWLAQQVLPIVSFEQCLNLGNPIVESYPRQCLLPNDDIFLEIFEPPTEASLSIKNFDDCLIKGLALINTFPRKCIAGGGYVYTEPPRLPSNFEGVQ